MRARAVGLLGERQRVTDAKQFKAAKKTLGIKSHRKGFGPGAEWYWSMPMSARLEVREPTIEETPTSATRVAYAEHSRPELRDLVSEDDREPRIGGPMAEWHAGTRLTATRHHISLRIGVGKSNGVMMSVHFARHIFAIVGYLPSHA